MAVDDRESSEAGATSSGQNIEHRDDEPLIQGTDVLRIVLPAVAGFRPFEPLQKALLAFSWPS